MKGTQDIQELINGIENGDRMALGKSITLIESKRSEDQALSNKLLQNLRQKSDTFRIAVSGSPGVGKSTLIDRLGMKYIELGHKVAVLAIDPSSDLSKGSILGDKTRMHQLSQNPNAFVRPTPAGSFLGGVGRKTRDTILLCEAAGYDRIIVETVGVGQSEWEASYIVDFFMLLILPGAGDDLQGIKRGIMEMADLIAINQADGDKLQIAKKTKSFYQSSLKIMKGNDNRPVPIMLCSALEGTGIPEMIEELEAYYNQVQSDDSLVKDRRIQSLRGFESDSKEMILELMSRHPHVRTLLRTINQRLESNYINIFEARTLLQTEIEKMLE